MLCSKIFMLIIFRFITLSSAKDECSCGWLVPDTGEFYTHRMLYNFNHMPDVRNMLDDPAARHFMKDWMIYDFWQGSDNPNIRLNAKYDHQNVEIKNGNLVMTQKAYSEQDLKEYKPVSIAGLQTKVTDILHGTFRVSMKFTGSNGGTCASFFWYHNDTSEIDIEAVTPGNSLVNDTINYTTHPSLNPDGSKIANATLSLPLGTTFTDFRVHGFDCSPAGVRYFLDRKLVHSDTHNVPPSGGSLQIKLWADGNKWWSGTPSKTDVKLYIQSISAYYNVTSSTQLPFCDSCVVSNVSHTPESSSPVFASGSHTMASERQAANHFAVLIVWSLAWIIGCV